MTTGFKIRIDRQIHIFSLIYPFKKSLKWGKGFTSSIRYIPVNDYDV